MSGLSRRDLLGGTAGGLASLLARRAFADPTSTPKNLVLILQNNGTQQGRFWPDATFHSPILDPLLNDSFLAARTTLVKGVYVPNEANGTNGNEHDIGFARMFTGAPLLDVGGFPWGGGPSVDQLVAADRKIESLALAVLTSNVEPFPKPGYQHRRSFSYVAPGRHKLPTLDPYEAYSRMFAMSPEQYRANRRKLLKRQSVLDAAAGNLRDLSARLGASERQKLELHASSLRDTERRISDTLAAGASTASACTLRPEQPKPYLDTAPALLLNDEAEVPQLVRTQCDLLATALACGVTSVATLQLGFAGGKWMFDWLGIHKEFHGDLAHADTTDAGADPLVTSQVAAANTWYATQVAWLARRLADIPLGDETLLDHTLIVWANELGRGNHSMENVPVVFIGGGGAPLMTGHRVADAGRQPFQRLGCTVLNAMGIPAAGFGDAPACGVFQGMTG